MKKVTFLSICLFFVMGVYSQVFNTSKTLKQGTFAVGVEPMIITKSGSDFILFGHIGYGLATGIDISAKASMLYNTSYYGGDIEFAFMDHFSVSAGAHVWGDFGLDATFLGSYDIANNVDIYGGADIDLNFGGNVYINFWIPIGIEVELNKNMAILLESSIGINSSAPHLFGGGVNVYF